VEVLDFESFGGTSPVQPFLMVKGTGFLMNRNDVYARINLYSLIIYERARSTGIND
jgi:hypothetical protein